MLENRSDADRLATRWGIGADDIMLIALNACGLNADIGVSRLRFRLRLNSRPDDQLYMILSLGRDSSPFRLVGTKVLLGGEQVAVIDVAEADDAVLGYWRNEGRVLTLNSNARSACTGCVFCPNTLEEANDPRLALDDLNAYFSTLVDDQHAGGLSNVEKVTLCTGCFRFEALALTHLRQVREAMTGHDCGGEIHFLSSVLTTPTGLAEAAAIGPFHLTLTAEAFTQRDLILKESKASLTPTEMVRVLGDAVEAGIRTDFTYIVGLDPLDTATRHLREFVDVTTTFPRFQVYQSHTPMMDVFLADGARNIEFYLAARREIEELFGPTGLRPQPWENYRPLWYFSFGDEPLTRNPDLNVMTYRIDRITLAPLPPIPSAGGGILPDWAQPALRTPAAQPWSENLRRFAVGVIDDAGSTGWFGPVDSTVATIVSDQLAPTVTGLDVRAWRAFQDLRPAGRHRSGAHARIAVSAVELAAWDLRSRATNTTVESLLGGAARTRVPTYATALGIDIDHPLAPDIASWLAEQGFWAQKWSLPGYERDESPHADAARLGRLRHTIGERARLCVDARGQWSRAYARQMLPVLGEHQVSWIEEPGHLDPSGLAGFGVACATGEHDYDPPSQLASLYAGGTQVWQPDPAWNGGLAHSVRMVEIAEMHGIPCFPHGTALAVALRLAALMPATAVPAIEYHLTLEPLRQAVHLEPLTPAQGHFTLTGEPGLSSPYRFPSNTKVADHVA